MVVVDTAHGHTQGVLDAVRRIKTAWPLLPVIAGNVVTEEGVDALVAVGVDAVKVGVGAGSICTTRVVAGAGMPQLSAIWYTAQRAAARSYCHRRRWNHVFRRCGEGTCCWRQYCDARQFVGWY